MNFEVFNNVIMYIFLNFKEPVTKIELVEGCGIFVTKRALDDAVDSSQNSGTRLIHTLISIFFSEDKLSRSNACGGGKKHTALDPDILAACYRKLLKTVFNLLYNLDHFYRICY